MIAEPHYKDEKLIELLDVGREDDEHLASCGDCRERLEAYRFIADALHDEATWDQRPLSEAPVPQTIANLRSFADRMADEDAAAEPLLAHLLAGDRDSWMPTLAAHPEYRTAGVVRKLIERVSHALDTMPRDAVELTNLATTIADSLDNPQLRGAAWREKAYALFYTGAFAAAEEAIATSERHLSECTVNEYEDARLGIVRALVWRAMEKFGVAIEAAARSAAIFSSYDDRNRGASAALAEVHLLYATAEFERAAGKLERLEYTLRASEDAETHARVLGNLAYCYWKLGRGDEALRFHDATATALDRLRILSESARVRWLTASILAAEGRQAEAHARFVTVRDVFVELGMTSEAALVHLDIADLLITQNRFEEVESICKAAMALFQSAGIPYTARALTAIAYVREAAQNRTVTPTIVHHVRTYIQRLPREQQLAFIPPNF